MPTPTGYTSSYTAAQIDSVIGEYLPQEIAENTDLNTLTTPGVYVGTSGVLATITNYPPMLKSKGYSFRVEVRKMNYAGAVLEQKFILGEDVLSIYERRYSNTWRDWYEHNNPPTVNIYNSDGVEQYFKIAEVTTNRTYILHMCGCTSSVASHFDIDIKLSNNSCSIYSTPINGTTGYGTSAGRCALYYLSGALYLKTSTYVGMTIVGYGPPTLFNTFEKISAIPSGATYLTVTAPNISSFNNDANYVASSNVATIYSGSSAPSSSTGNDGDIYIQTS